MEERLGEYRPCGCVSRGWDRGLGPGGRCKCSPPPGDRYCTPDKDKSVTYICQGTCFLPQCRNCGVAESTTVLAYKWTPVCKDTGFWPPGPECNEDADCEVDSLGPGTTKAFHDCECILTA